MKNELKATDNWSTMKTNEDPVETIKAIKAVTHSFCGQKCECGSVWHTNKRLCECKQREDEDVRLLRTAQESWAQVKLQWKWI